MKRILFYLLVLTVASSCAAARYARGPETEDILSLPGYDGIIEAVTYDSSEPDLSKRRMVVYLPPSYYADTVSRYPVMYLLHGARGNEITWNERGDAFRSLDSLRAKSLAKDFILVLPNMNNYSGDKDYKNGHAMNAVRAFWLLDGEAERYFVQDVVNRVDSLYRTVPEKQGRAIAGMSSGALQGIYLSADHPDTFGYVGLFSPYNHPTFAALGHRDVYGHLWKRLEGQFADPPVYIIYIGNTDIFYPHMRIYHNNLEKKDYPHRFVITPGGHEWYNWSYFLIDFYKEIFR